MINALDIEKITKAREPIIVNRIISEASDNGKHFCVIPYTVSKSTIKDLIDHSFNVVSNKYGTKSIIYWGIGIKQMMEDLGNESNVRINIENINDYYVE